jgi:type I restriction enzyme R subunit
MRRPLSPRRAKKPALERGGELLQGIQPERPGQANTGIAFLIVCDMLLTGFDAPIEQVMYIDKKLREHTLLQAIARTNRVSRGKKRGYIVDYIGLANHLTEALTIYAASDELQELQRA